MPSMEVESLMSQLFSLHLYNLVSARKDLTEVKKDKKSLLKSQKTQPSHLSEHRTQVYILVTKFWRVTKFWKAACFVFRPAAAVPAWKVSFPVLSFCKQRENMDAVDEWNNYFLPFLFFCLISSLPDLKMTQEIHWSQSPFKAWQQRSLCLISWPS